MLHFLKESLSGNEEALLRKTGTETEKTVLTERNEASRY
jgi:hypothetical protein